MSQFDGMDPKEISFITHPHWRKLIEEIEKDPDLAYSITQDGKPVAVIISPIAFERVVTELQELGERLQAVEP